MVVSRGLANFAQLYFTHHTHTYTALRDRRDSSLSVGVRTAKAAERRASKNSLHKLKRNSDMPSSNEDLSES